MKKTILIALALLSNHLLKAQFECYEYGNLTKDFEAPHEFAGGKFEGDRKVQIGLGWGWLGGCNMYSITGTKKKRE